MQMRLATLVLAVGLLCPHEVRAARADIPAAVKAPYLGAIVVDAATGDVLFEDSADAVAYPASVLKLMDLLVILEKLDRGELRLDEIVRVTAAAARMGGSQVYLKEGEAFTLDEMLYALMVQSANDAALALALHVGGTKEGFLTLMNKRAAELGMTAARFHSVHGLPPGAGQEVDVASARDIAKLCVELLKHPDALRYTSTQRREFRAGTADPFVMETHNRLLGSFEGCDGLKTGYFKLAGYSTAATASRDGRRAIAVVMGSPERATRDNKARELLTQGLQVLASRAKPAPVETQLLAQVPIPAESKPPKSKRMRKIVAGVVIAVVAASALRFIRRLKTPGR
ncbi:MAG: D-alanyl-D-alanine carboxypeptidase [Kiritimatiellae bacterium]|nr:D-alanyl-D-alanine carboxypeptidase [Kiritimatiellia bacterium]